MMDAMTPAELDSDGKIFMDDSSKLPEGQPRPPNARVLRVARGSGTSVNDVEQMLGQYVMMQTMFKRMGPAALRQQQAAKGLGPGGMPSPAQIEAAKRA